MSADPTCRIEYDHHSADFIAGHRQQNADLRSRCPVAYSTTYGGFWVLSKYDDVFAAAHDDSTFSAAISQLIPPTDAKRLLPIQTDPPETQRYRSLLTPYLTPRALAGMYGPIQADIDAAVGAIVERGHGEVVAELCNPVPARATMRLLGMDPDGWAAFGGPLHAATFSVPGSDEQVEALCRVRGFTELIEREVDDRYATPRDDLITALTTSEVDGVRTSREEVVDLVRMVIFGGMDTVMAALSNILAILAERSDLRRRLASNPSSIPRAVEEFLRYEAPIQGFARRVTADAKFAGQDLTGNDRVWLGWGSANHDESVFAEPDELDLERVPNRHLTFGVGVHRCLGSTLARTELRMVLQTFLAAIPEFRPTAPGIVQPATIGQILGKRAVHIAVGA